MRLPPGRQQEILMRRRERRLNLLSNAAPDSEDEHRYNLAWTGLQVQGEFSDAALSRFDVIVRLSSLPGAGRGVFATVAKAAGETLYLSLPPIAQADDLSVDELKMSYSVDVAAGRVHKLFPDIVFDYSNLDKADWVRFINSARGAGVGVRPNVSLVNMDGILVLYALEGIPIGAELLENYCF